MAIRADSRDAAGRAACVARDAGVLGDVLRGRCIADVARDQGIAVRTMHVRIGRMAKGYGVHERAFKAGVAAVHAEERESRIAAMESRGAVGWVAAERPARQKVDRVSYWCWKLERLADRFAAGEWSAELAAEAEACNAAIVRAMGAS